MKTRLTNYFKAGFPAVAIQTTEEQRAQADVIAAAKDLKVGVATWSATEGMKRVLPRTEDFDSTEDLLAACRLRLTDTIIILRDPHQWPFNSDPTLARAFRDLLVFGAQNGSTVVVIAPEFKPWSAVEKMVTVIDYTLPDKAALTQIAEGMRQSGAMTDKDGKETLPDPATDEVLRALSGLSTSESENALALSLIETNRFDAGVIYREKIQAVRRSGLLEIIDADPRGLDAIGGLDNLKDWIMRRKRAFTPDAEKYGLPMSKGIMLVGCPGAGKSLSARAFGTALNIPTLKLDIGNLFNSLVGESEARTRDALKLAEAMAPAVIWLDEVDKGMAGASGSGSGDSGVTRRVFGTVLSWMQERKRPVFVVATANQVEFLPPEVLRKGRFDEIFALDLPNPTERAAIAEVLLRKKKRDPETFDMKLIVKSTHDFTGAEIEAAIDEALFAAFDQEREVTAQDICLACMSTQPLAKMAKEKIDAIRAWAKGRARPASKPETETNTNVRKLNRE